MPKQAPRIGSLFSGYGGLDLAIAAVFGARTVWHCEYEEAPSKILAHHWPDIPNLGDITRVDWSQVEPIDILTGGSPCQDLSAAGRRAGMTEGTRSNLWVNMREAIAQLQPRLVVWENVKGALSATASSASDLEPGEGLLGAGAGGYLRALGRVLGDLADLGYDARWTTLRASDVGAPHHRARVFLVAYPDIFGWGEGSFESGAGETEVAATLGDAAPAGQRAPVLGALLPTPTVVDMGNNSTPEEWDEWTTRMKARHGNGNGHGPSLAVEALRLLPTPTTGSRGDCPSERDRNSPDLQAVTFHFPTPNASDSTGGGVPPASRVGHSNQIIDAVLTDDLWGKYGPAIRRWEAIVGPAPAPTEPNKNGNPRLNAAFAEWMMGLPGWVTNVPGLTRGQQLKAIGNGVCPQQAIAGIQQCYTLGEVG